jgi:pimeloyl-ACP methyl ester carboxylesterase
VPEATPKEGTSATLGEGTPVETGTTLVNGHHLHWQTGGPADGPVVVLLHTGLGTVDDWRATAPVLARQGYRTLAYDRWGYGRSDARPDFAPPPFDGDVADLTTLLDLLGVRRAALVGHSDGGTIALALAARAPDRVTCVVAVAAHVCVEYLTREGVRDLQARYDTDPVVRAALRRRHGAKADRLVHDWVGGWRRAEAWKWDMRPEIGLVRCPALIVQGEGDEHATPDHARDIAEGIAGAELWIVEGVGHLLPQAIPEAFNARLLGFLGRVTGEG